jgi:hypothetical protein
MVSLRNLFSFDDLPIAASTALQQRNLREN